MKLVPGLYESIINGEVATALDHTAFAAERARLDPGDAHRVLARYLADILARALRALPSDDRLKRQLAVANTLLDTLAHEIPGFDFGSGYHITPELLLSLVRRDALAGAASPIRPGTPLADSALLVNARGEHRIGEEVRRELASADAVDLLCSFLLWTGWVRLREEVRALLQRGARVRVLTTVYCGVTERRVLDDLCRLGAEVRVSYDVRRTRLHAKAWLFHRETGFHTAYVGSSNLSAAALSDGLEWNVRLSVVDAPQVLAKFRAAFDGYWSDGEFEPYDPSRDAERFDAAIGGERPDELAERMRTGVRVEPFPYQTEILETLDVERRIHNRWRNLVVAATGTGKTVIAALDYRREVERFGPMRLLFVAHRREILEQSRRVFRRVLQDSTFGGLYVDGERPRPGQSVFASIQSLARIDPNDLAGEGWDYVIVDEFHHAEAETYVRLLESVAPKILVGLTATPERADGRDPTRWFGWKIAAELRLWDAIDRGLLAPFQYFGLADDVDISGHFRRGSLDLSALDLVYSSHHLRAKAILEAVAAHVVAPRKMRAIGFCVGVAHAQFMAQQFTLHGVPAAAVTGDDDTFTRTTTLEALERGEIAIIFTVDLFNEGIDLPAIDTVLFLRPTESATIFLQQLGRGLRLAPGKRCLTALDFIGNSSREFRFDARFRALVGGTRAELSETIDAGFPVLPAGCSISLEPDAARRVLDNLRYTLSNRSDRLVRELRSLGPATTLSAFLEHTRLELEDIYREDRTFSSLRRAAGFSSVELGNLGGAIKRMLQVDDPSMLEVLASVARGGPVSGPIESTLVTFCGEVAVTDPHAAVEMLRAQPGIREELTALVPLLRARVRHVAIPYNERLKVHCRYRLEQITAAFGATGGKLRPREGVWFDESSKSDVFFVTLNKAERDYSPSTMYDDYAIAPDQFHWQTQAATTPTSERGQRNLRHRELGITPLLFVRERRKDTRGETQPYLFLGPATLISWEGQKPMNIVWRLMHPMPADFFRLARVAA